MSKYNMESKDGICVRNGFSAWMPSFLCEGRKEKV